MAVRQLTLRRPNLEAGPAIGLAIALILVTAAPGAAQGTRSEDGTYVGGAVTLGVCTPGGTPAPNIVCFWASSLENEVDLAIQDEVNDPVCGAYEFYDENGTVVGGGNFVGSTGGPIALPNGTYEISVFPGAHHRDGAGKTLLDAPSCPYQKATTGTVEAVFFR